MQRLESRIAMSVAPGSEELTGPFVDVVGPSVAAIGAPAIVGDVLSVDVRFSEPVVVSGTPALNVSIGDFQRRLLATDVVDDAVTFSYQLRNGESPVGAVVGARVIERGNSSIRDVAGNAPVSLAAPTRLLFARSGIDENVAIGTAVGTFTTRDRDSADSFTYALVPGDGSADNGSFAIVGNELRTASLLDYESQNQFSIRVRSSDAGGLSIERRFTLSIRDVNDNGPAITSGDTGSIDGNAPIDSAIYTATANDADGTRRNRAVRFSIKQDVGDFNLVRIDTTTGVVTRNANANHVGRSSYSFTVVAANTATPPLSGELAVTVDVTNVAVSGGAFAAAAPVVNVTGASVMGPSVMGARVMGPVIDVGASTFAAPAAIVGPQAVSQPGFGSEDLRFLLSRVRSDRLPEELGGLAPLGPTGIRDVQGVGNNTTNPLSPNWWFGAGDTLFPRLTFNRLTAVGKKNDVVSSVFANSPRGTQITVGFTTKAGPSVNAATVDALNPRVISNLVVDSSNPIGFAKANADFKLLDDPTGRVSPVSGAVNPLPYSNWTGQFGQFFDHGLDFVSKGIDGSAKVQLLPSDGLYTANRATSITASRSNTVSVTIGEGSTDALLAQLGLAGQEGVVNFAGTSTIANAGVTTGLFPFSGMLVLNQTLIEIAATDDVDLASQINFYTPTTGVTALVEPFPAFDPIVAPGSFRLDLVPARAESFNQTSPFIDLSQSYGSDASRTVFLREYLSVGTGIAARTTGRLLNAGQTIPGESMPEMTGKAGMANWAQVKANAANVGLVLHDADIMAVPLVAFDTHSQLILGADGMPRLVALNKVTGEVVYVQNTTLADDPAIQSLVADPATNWAVTDFVLVTTKHAFLNDMGVRLPAMTDAAWGGRDLSPSSPLKAALEAHYVGGDGRINENIGLTAVHEAFLTHHNRILELLKQQYGFVGDQPQGGWAWSDPLTGAATQITGEELFQQAKIVLEMQYQHMVFDQFVRKLSPNIAGFAGVDPLIDARIDSEFANSVYRLGHSMMPDAIGMRQYTDTSNFSTAPGSNVVTVTMVNHGLKAGESVKISGVSVPIGGLAADAMNGTFTVTILDNNRFSFVASAVATAAATGSLVTPDKVQVDINRGLIDAFLSPATYKPGFTSTLLTQGSTAQVGMRIDEKVTDSLRDNLLGQPLDLATLNLVRGRDAGIPTLNEMRGALVAVAPPGLQPTLTPYASWTTFRDNLKGSLDDQNVTVKNFIMAYASDDILTKFQSSRTLAQWYTLRESTNPADQAAYLTALRSAADAAFASPQWMAANKDFNRIDAWVGGLAEREVAGGMLGPTFDAVFAMQMMKLQDGDFFYYLGRVPTTEFFLENIEGTMLADLVMSSTGATNVYADIFSVADSYVQIDVSQPAQVSTLPVLQASTTIQQVLDAGGNQISAAVGRAGFVGTPATGTVFYGNPGNYTDARGVLNPNGVGNASEMIGGTTGNDVIFSLGGNDTVRAEEGDDIVDGGAGVDFVYGGVGNDTLDGGTEDDFVYGGDGNDTVLGGLGIDVLFGNTGDDLLFGGADGDIMQGGAGNDILYGGDGIVVGGVLDPEPAVAVGLFDDTLDGGSGDDVLLAGGGWDTLNGASGNDVLIPGTGGAAVGGRESMDGGQGDDLYIVESDADFAFQDFADTGLTQLQLLVKGPSFQVGNGLGIDEVRFTQTDNGSIVIAGANALGIVQLFTGVERIVIGTGTGPVADTSGTANIDIDASLANPGINVGLEIIGNAGDSILIGTNFNDRIDGGLGADTLEGLIGDDTYVVRDQRAVVLELLGSGNDTVEAVGSFGYVLPNEVENLTLFGTGVNGTGNALDNVIVGNDVANVLLGLAGNDTIRGGGGDDRIEGGAGSDVMTGGLGADRFVFGSVADIGNDPLLLETITDLEAVDLLDFTAIDANVVAAGAQEFVFVGGNAFTAPGQLRLVNGILSGNIDANLAADFQMSVGAAFTAANLAIVPIAVGITSNNGAGVLELNTSRMSVHSFTVTLSKAASAAITLSWAVSSTGLTNPADAVDFGGTLPSGTVTIAAGQTTGQIQMGVWGDTIVEANENFRVTLTPNTPAAGLYQIATATATSVILNDDVAPINGTPLNDTLNGTLNADTINGLAGNDVINGLAGGDTIDGGAGNDTINGGAGSDVMTGGLGADRFVFSSVSDIGNDPLLLETITDLEAADLLDFTGIDANSVIAGVQEFAFIGGNAFTAPGQLRYANGILSGNVDGNLAADFQLSVGPTFAATNLVRLPVTVSIASNNGAGVLESNTASTSTHTFTVTLSAAALAPITLNWAVSSTGLTSPADAADFGTALPSGTVTIIAGQTTAQIPVTVRGDALLEANENFRVTLTPNTPVASLYQIGTATAASVILNDDIAPITGTAANNTLTGTSGNDTINGLGGNDTIDGQAGNDTIDGGTGNDTINGGDGDDTIVGGSGLDRLTGGLGRDTFVYFSTAESPVGTPSRDVITDFVSGTDRIDVSAIDANASLAGNQAFVWIGSAAFTGLGQVRYVNGVLQFNTTGDTAADMAIQLLGSPAISGTDFVL